MASEVTVAHVEATKELTVEVFRKVGLPDADYEALPERAAERVGEIYKIIFRAVVKPRED